jgi:hypothetical protein
MRVCLLALCAALILSVAANAVADEVRVVSGFEADADLAQWQVVAGTPKRVAEGVTEGQSALEITFDPNGEYYPAILYWDRPVGDWSPYDALVVDVTNPNAFPIQCSVLVGDQPWADRGRSYWNRHNGSTTLAPGKRAWVIPVRGLYRGEAGSRNNDIKTDIDPSRIVRLDLSFGSKGQTGRVLVDNIRFVTVAKAEGVWAFDFGPPSQAVMLGWTAVDHATAYSSERGYGWGPEGGTPWDGADRDTTFGPMLTRDFCEAGGYRFRVDVPAGTYDVLAVFENCGYWGGEQAMHATRSILVDGAQVWSEQRPNESATALYRFEDVEPVGVDLWDTYMAPEITKPVRFSAKAGADGLTLQFRSDAPFGCRLSGLAVYRQGDAKAAAWVDAQWAQVRDDFRAQAVCLDPPPTPLDATGDWAAKGFVAWPARIEGEITPGCAPAAPVAPGDLALQADVVRGEHEPLCLVIRPIRDLGDCTVTLRPSAGFPTARVDVVRYGLSRGFGSIAYHTVAHALRPLRPATAVALPAGIAREFLITVATDVSTSAGTFSAEVLLSDQTGAALLTVPLRVTVHDVPLERDTDFLMGFFGLEPPERMLAGAKWDRALEQTLDLLREHGMNALSGGPSLRLTGWTDGRPQIDFSACDRFFDLCKRHGFPGPINGYEGMRFVGLHDGYEKGEMAAKVAQESGLDYPTAIERAWAAVDEHARAQGWPTIFYAMCDETRVRDVAERELEFMELMAKISAKYPTTVQTSGSYSVDFHARPTDPEDLTFWHQRFFGALDVSSLNLHDDTVMAEARKLGKAVHIYNQGTSRYSFGLYQWSEFRKGVRARWQWHLNVLHGYQFFDLDGREPDTSMICYGRNGIYPTIQFERCREGAEDFYLYQTLARAVEAARAAGGKADAAGKAAKLLERLTAGIAIDQREAPPGYDPYATKLAVVQALEELR